MDTSQSVQQSLSRCLTALLSFEELCSELALAWEKVHGSLVVVLGHHGVCVRFRLPC